MVDRNMYQVFNIYSSKIPIDSQIRKLNQLLSSSKTFTDGLQLLKSILKYCSVELLNEGVINWLDDCLLKHAGENVEIKLYIIGKFVEASFNNHDLSKKILSDYLAKIVEMCLADKSDDHEIEASLDVLTACMKKYNSWFVNSKTKVETYILSFLDNLSSSIVEKAGEAFLYLQQVGNAGIDMINYKNNFKISLQKLCATAHKLFDTFLENEFEIDNIDKPNQDPFQLENICDPSELLQITGQRIKNVVMVLFIMIQKGFTVPREITPIEILNVIKRGIAVHHCVSTPNEKSPNDYDFCFLLIDIQGKLLHLLEVLILWLRNNSFPYALIISKMLIQCLKRTRDCSCYKFNYGFFQKAYVVTKCWISISKCALNSHIQTEIIRCLLKDIEPIKNSVTLKLPTEGMRKHVAKHRNSKFPTNNVSTKEIVLSKFDMERDELRCQLALDTLATLFSVSHILVDKELLQSVFSITLNVLNDIIGSKIPYPYENYKTQAKLNQLLGSFYEQEHLESMPHLALSLNITNYFSSSRSFELASICQQNLSKLEKLSQPLFPPFLISSKNRPRPPPVSESSVEDIMLRMECIIDITDDGVDTNTPIKYENNDCNKGNVEEKYTNEKTHEEQVKEVSTIENQSLAENSDMTTNTIDCSYEETPHHSVNDGNKSKAGIELECESNPKKLKLADPQERNGSSTHNTFDRHIKEVTNVEDLCVADDTDTITDSTNGETPQHSKISSHNLKEVIGSENQLNPKKNELTHSQESSGTNSSEFLHNICDELESFVDEIQEI